MCKNLIIGGSGAAGPLYADFCYVMLGWSSLSGVAKAAPVSDRSTRRLTPSLVPGIKRGDDSAFVEVVKSTENKSSEATFDAVLGWAQGVLKVRTPRQELEAILGDYQREFLGGKTRDLEVLTSGGGTRSINYAMESVMKVARAAGISKPKILTGNPHLAVERAERRFGFEVVRVVDDGAICLNQLDEAISDPEVVAVYSQTLSYTDGISDALGQIVYVVEKENIKRSKSGQPLVVLINDSCLAFSILVHNDGKNGRPSMRVLDLTSTCITPVMVTLDAHKHLGTDKGVSTVIGTPGTLSHLKDAVLVGSQPSEEELVRAISDMWLVGIDGYYRLYEKLVIEVDKGIRRIQAAGMTLIHARNRYPGSTVIAIEDPSAVLMKRLKKLNHSTASLYNICPAHPERCQTGFGLSLTAHVMRVVRDDKTALDVFLEESNSLVPNPYLGAPI